MSIYVSDPWDALSPGFTGPPTGWTLFGNSTVFASDGAFPGHNFGNGFFSPLQTPLFLDPFPPADFGHIQVAFGAQVNNGFQFNISCIGATGDPVPVITIVRENDSSISIKSGPNPANFLTTTSGPHSPGPANSGFQTGTYFFKNVWYYFVLTMGFRQDATGIGFLGVNSNLNVDGGDAIPDSRTQPGQYIPLSLFPTSGSPPVLSTAFDQGSWFGDPNVSFLTQVQFSDVGDALPDPTVPVARIPQAVNELGLLPVDANVRIPQAVVETGIQPVHANVRIPQMVIELARPFRSGGGPLPEYIKRRNLFANN